MPDSDSRRGPPRADRRGFVRQGVAGALLALNLSQARAGSVVAVRVWPAEDYTRVTLELDAPMTHRQSMLADPPRVILDVEGLTLDGALREIVGKIRSDDPYIARVRIGQYTPEVVRLVFDLKKAVAPRLFTLPPIDEYRHRLVLDLHPMVPIDPLADMLARSGAEADPIDALIRKRSTPAPAPAPVPPVARAEPMPQWVPLPEPGRPPATRATPTPSKRAPSGKRSPKPPVVDRLVTVAIDPGHGGEDPGAIGKAGTREKDVVLAIGKRLRARIAAEPGMRAFMTRDGDFFVPLATRVAKARRVQADLFVSIHADAFLNPQARGASVYVLSEARASSSTARWLATRENRADLIGGVDLGGRNREVAKLLLELSTTAQIRDSSNLGRMVLGQLGTVGRLHKPAIEKAGFAVLRAPDIPSILVETAFISNPEEEKRLASSAYQDRIADAIFTGIRHYLIKYPPPRHASQA